MRTWFLVTILTASLSACTVTRPPFEPIAKAHTQIAQAQMAKAEQAAPSEMAMARELVNHAEKALYNYDYRLAEDFAEESAAVADLARVKARWAESSQQTQQAEADFQMITKTLAELHQHTSTTTATDPMSAKSGELNLGLQKSAPASTNKAELQPIR